ncbi:hypothetical protein GO730_15350 [Spirosoma sp. HMF3257]|uniref:Uncharacterized protein n=1 Tax=Spirosoma telluris TaxID=2183553 RepID=A0A327NR92_9BACT|nr:hypothetical protein [Spirosoma telluris]RAI75218.1 hypothetical protein HMF3257_15295 [Spirosoma telluris]
MNTETLTPDEQARAHYRLEFARAWMARKRQEQQEMIEEAKTDPKIIAAFAELDRRATERGTRIIEL